MNKTVLRGTVITPVELISRGQVELHGGKISYAGPKRSVEGQVIEHDDAIICPGLIDIHIHGALGYDFMDPTPKAMDTISKYLAEGGVTGFLATTHSSSQSKSVNTIKQISAYRDLPGAKLLGIHLEGPYLSHKKKGAQDEAHIRKLDLNELKDMVLAGNGLIKIVTIAPEIDEGLEAIKYLSESGVTVSAGHTNALFEEAKEAIDLGLNHISHLFNGMRGFHHREPGIVGVALTDGRVTVELIADGVHLHPVALRIAALVKGGQGIALISDSIKPAGLPEGQYKQGNKVVFVRDGQLRLADGTIAGSGIRLNQAVKTMIEEAGISLTEAVQMATLTPSRILGLSSVKGRLSEGYDADITVMDWDFLVRETWVEGTRVYDDGS
ncbi:N-acetylglucosamine-6-phosphate deacetylase [Candidatus Bathyarchaeota archaeon]|nr:N-acetylglucosamine-6-phosphate deacetylase [Candidatus Bathyarchaeota archaeon]